MIKATLLLLGLILTTNALAADKEHHVSAEHFVTIAGLQPGEGRYILATEYVNNKFRAGGYICAGEGDPVYGDYYDLPRSQIPFHEEHLIKFSICQDETLAECHEFAVDKYRSFRNLEGYIENDSSIASVDLSPIKDTFKACEPHPSMDALVKKSIYISDRRFAQVG